MDEIISNNQLRTFLQRQILTTEKYNHNPKLDGLKYCGSRAINPSNPVSVKLIANQKESKFTGIARCHSPWSCPDCSAKVMAQKAGDIACAIDALSTWYKLYPMMITFTLPHTSQMTCEETYTILLNTWHRVIKDGKRKITRKYTLKGTKGETLNKSYGADYRTKTSKGAGTKNKYDQRNVGTAGEEKIYDVTTGFAKFRQELDIQHTVRAYEFTWGENSWHPHIHALFWTHEKNWNKIANYEPELLEYWWKYAKAETLKLWNKKHPEKADENKKRADLLYSDFMKEPNGEHRSVHISKDANGAIRKISSSAYICGWGGDLELTGQTNIKVAKKGHYTPFQMLELAYKNATQREKWLNLFIEYATATRGHRRLEFSTHSGIRKIIDKWKKTNTYITQYKKKSPRRAENTR